MGSCLLASPRLSISTCQQRASGEPTLGPPTLALACLTSQGYVCSLGHLPLASPVEFALEVSQVTLDACPQGSLVVVTPPGA